VSRDSRETRRAAAAFAVAARSSSGPQAGDFLRLARQLPGMLQTNGLLATWAYLLGKDEAFLAHLFEHLRSCGLLKADETGSREILLARWTAEDGTQRLDGLRLRRLTAEALDYAVWLKRAAEGLAAREVVE